MLSSFAPSRAPHLARRTWHHRLVPLLLALLASCWDFNEDVSNPGPGTITRVRIVVRLEGSYPTFPAVSEWYNGLTPTITPLGPPTPASSLFELEWTITIPPGGTAHVGWEFANPGIPMKKLGDAHTYAGIRRDTSSLACATRQDAAHGLVIDLSVDSAAPGPVQVTRLQWTASTTRLPLSTLATGNPTVEALPWTSTPQSVPFVLSPGQTITLDAPDATLASYHFGLLRYESTDVTFGVPHAAFYQLPNTASVPALGPVALAAFAVLLAACGWFVLRRRRLGERRAFA